MANTTKKGGLSPMTQEDWKAKNQREEKLMRETQAQYKANPGPKVKVKIGDRKYTPPSKKGGKK